MNGKIGIIALMFGVVSLALGHRIPEPVSGQVCSECARACWVIWQEGQARATEYLGVKQVAERLGITSGGLLNLKLPEPDATIGRTRGWLPETIDEWNAQRPGRGVGGGRPRKNKA